MVRQIDSLGVCVIDKDPLDTWTTTSLLLPPLMYLQPNLFRQLLIFQNVHACWTSKPEKPKRYQLPVIRGRILLSKLRISAPDIHRRIFARYPDSKNPRAVYTIELLIGLFWKNLFYYRKKQQKFAYVSIKKNIGSFILCVKK